MTNRAIVERQTADYSGEELAVIMETLIGADPGTVCAVAAVVVIHGSDGNHTLKIAVTDAEGPAAAARLLRHAADHADGGCKRCRRGNARLKR